MKPNLASLSLSSVLTLVATACGGSEPTGTLPDDTIPCRTGNCGKPTFRSAVPSRTTVKIDFQRSAQKPGVALEAVAPGYVALGEHVDEVNTTVDEIFEELELLVGGEPEIEEDTRHRWRIADPDLADTDVVLTLESANEVDFTLAYAIGPTGFDADSATNVLTGAVHLDEGQKAEFALTIDFDAATTALPGLDLTGSLEISARPFAEAGREIWYDFVAFGELDQELETSLTTYWLFAEDDYALEYIDSIHDSDATLFARWNDDSGRLDYHVDWTDLKLGELDEIGTNCWGTGGSEQFYGWAVIDEASHYVEVDGDETACVFGPLEGHPNPTEEFVSLPAQGEWDDLLASAAPFCEDAPEDPDCVDYCELLPESCSK